MCECCGLRFLIHKHFSICVCHPFVPHRVGYKWASKALAVSHQGNSKTHYASTQIPHDMIFTQKWILFMDWDPQSPGLHTKNVSLFLVSNNFQVCGSEFWLWWAFHWAEWSPFSTAMGPQHSQQWQLWPWLFLSLPHEHPFPSILSPTHLLSHWTKVTVWRVTGTLWLLNISIGTCHILLFISDISLLMLGKQINSISLFMSWTSGYWVMDWCCLWMLWFFLNMELSWKTWVPACSTWSFKSSLPIAQDFCFLFSNIWGIPVTHSCHTFLPWWNVLPESKQILLPSLASVGIPVTVMRLYNITVHSCSHLICSLPRKEFQVSANCFIVVNYLLWFPGKDDCTN